MRENCINVPCDERSTCNKAGKCVDAASDPEEVEGATRVDGGRGPSDGGSAGDGSSPDGGTGGMTAFVCPTEAACVVRANANCANKRKPSEIMRSQVMVDTMVFSEEGLRHLVAEMGVSQVAYGTDVPFNWPVTVDLVLNAQYLSDADKTAILSGNLMKLLRIS